MVNIHSTSGQPAQASPRQDPLGGSAGNHLGRLAISSNPSSGTRNGLPNKLAHYSVILWALGILAVAELGLEARARARGWGTLVYGAPKYAQQPAGSPFGPTGDYPFRSTVVPRQKPPGVQRVWVASASYGEHIFLPAEKIFPVLLEEELRLRGLNVQVLNASRGGLTTRSAVRDLEQVAPDWNPDVVLVYHLSNDIDGLTTRMLGPSANESAPAVIHSERAEAPLGAPSAPQSEIEWGPWPTRQARHTTLYSLAKNLVGSRLTAARMLHDQVPAEVALAYEARLEDAIHATQHLGAIPVLVTFATSQPLGDLHPMPENYQRNLLRSNSVLSMDGWRSTVASWNDRLVQVGTEREVSVIDLVPAIAGRPELFIDFVHFTPEGHAEVARILADGLLPILEGLER